MWLGRRRRRPPPPRPPPPPPGRASERLKRTLHDKQSPDG